MNDADRAWKVYEAAYQDWQKARDVAMYSAFTSEHVQHARDLAVIRDAALYDYYVASDREAERAAA